LVAFREQDDGQTQKLMKKSRQKKNPKIEIEIENRASACPTRQKKKLFRAEGFI